jgi:predicted deacylase
MSYFSPSYGAARERFAAALAAAGFRHEAHRIAATGPAGEALSIDVGIRPGSRSERALVITSGLHGVEGYFGSAVQLALLDDPTWLAAAAGQTIVLLHALNPYGFAWNRRWNEDNVDLNRSFFTADEPRPMSSAELPNFVRLLNADRPPRRLDTYALEAAWHAARHGLAMMKRTLPSGQYEHPSYLFYGGRQPSATQLILATHLARWIGPAEHVQLLDFHTGLGKWGTYKLLVAKDTEAHEFAELRRRFGAETMEDLDQRQGIGGVSYPTSGDFLRWFRAHFAERDCHATLAEFGTYPMVRVLRALRAENRAHHAGEPGGRHAWTKRDLLEMFAPASGEWRRTVVGHGKEICLRAIGD